MLVLVNAYISLRSCGSLNAEIQCCDIVSITSWLVTASFEWYRAHHKHAWWCRILHTTLWEFIRILIRALLRTATSSRSRSYPPTETRTPSLLALLHTGAAIGCQSHAKRGGKRERERERCARDAVMSGRHWEDAIDQACKCFLLRFDKHGRVRV